MRRQPTTTLKNIKGVSTELKSALVEEALKSGRSVSDVAISILSTYFKIKPFLQGNTTTTPNLGSQLLLKVERNGPLALSLYSAAREWQLTESSAAVKVLSAHYGLPFEPRRPGPKKKQVTA
jgi:hypothetical protein